MKIRNMAKKFGVVVASSVLLSAPAFATTGAIDITEVVAVIAGFVTVAIALGIAFMKLTATRKGMGKLGG